MLGSPNVMKQNIGQLFAKFAPQAYKRYSELKYWQKRASTHGLSNPIYESLYTTAYDLAHEDYAKKRVLDIGCGPSGSLEWADMAQQRVGLDPLVPQYLKLGAKAHKMEYVAASSENIPFPDAYFDIVSCINALDHVDDFDKTVSEIKRVTKPGGLFLVAIEIDHPPTATEPLTLTRESMRQLEPEFQILSKRLVAIPEGHRVHHAMLPGAPSYRAGEPGMYIAKMQRTNAKAHSSQPPM